MDVLRLEIPEFTDADHWRWLLTNSDGNYLADHQVALHRSDPEYLAFADLAGYLRRQADPGRRLVSEAALVARVGGWIGRQVLGEHVGRAMVKASPVVVRVVVPLDADFLLYRPLELAHASADDQPAQPLAVQDVSLIFEVQGEDLEIAKQPIDERLRIVAVFSLPSEGTALALRRERYQLVQLVRRVAGRYRRAVDLQVLQYGVTRQRLEDTLSDGRGWDVLHISGHGLAGGLLLEQADGRSDLLHTHELVSLLRPARRRLKLVTLSSCQSAAATTAETRRWLQLSVPQTLEAEADAEAGQAPLPALARELVRRLGCAVLAMRYPVVDDFAIALDEHLYEGLLGRDQDLPRALQRALPAAAGPQPTPGAPALSVATPTMVGPLAAELRLRPPPGTPDFNIDTQKMAYFPDEPERFVGRAGPMARATATLAPANPQVGVLFHGMAGAGKTACALELAYRHEQAFGQLVWWRAPEQGREIATSLRDLAVALETQLPGLVMVPAVASAEQLAVFLPQLTQLLEQQAVLLVLDNLESLLTGQGCWRDPRWAELVSALTSHRGESRVVLTSRIRPQGLDDRVLIEPVHALSLDEALLLARELPNLGRLVQRDPATPVQRVEDDPATPVQRVEDDLPSGWTLMRRTLEVVQGHPKLLELADTLASDPKALARQLAAADQTTTTAAERDRLAVFFERGQTGLAEAHFVRVLGDWTHQVVQTLPPPSAMLFGVLCCLEESDRNQAVVEPVWPHVWQQLGQPSDPPTLMGALEPLVGAGLVAAEGDPADYRIHPGVAEAGREQADGRIQQAVDGVLAAFWQHMFGQAMQAEEGEAGALLLHASRSAAPYFLRLQDWATAGRLLEQVVVRDQAPGTLQAVLPLLRRIAQATRGSADELDAAAVLAKALRHVEPAAAEEQLREVLDRAVNQQRFDLATITAGDLVNLLREAGRHQEALTLVEQKAELTRRAGLGPWTQLGDRGWRLQVLSRMGRDEEVLTEIETLRAQMAALPEQSEQEERSLPWNVREGVLITARAAAQNLKRWQDSLAFGAEVARSQQARDAPDYEVARTRFRDYYPLLQLSKLAEAERLLLACREVFEAEGDLRSLGRTYSALADLEHRRNNLGEAIRLEQTSLRYAYEVVDPDGIAVSHYNLASYLRLSGRDTAVVVAHRLAAAFVWYKMSSGSLPTALDELAQDLAAAGDSPSVPKSFTELCATVGQAEGVRLADLAARLPRRQGNYDVAIAELARLARMPREARE